jgi:hypothetical protein
MAVILSVKNLLKKLIPQARKSSPGTMNRKRVKIGIGHKKEGTRIWIHLSRL